ncbi:MAG: EI24 domain-containing protein [Mariprofundus sp.]|nr:EI24 domain-containing protein [Mariprofundus sp.]
MIRGALALLSGMQLLLRRSELRAILWRMLALLLVLMVVLASATFWLVDYITALWIPAGDAWYWQVLSWLAGLLAFVLAMICGIVSFVTLGSAVSAPWLDDLAARTEALSGKQVAAQSSGWMQLILQSLANSIRPLFGLLMWGGAALLFFWLPPLATAIWTYGAVRFLSYELIDPTASRRSWGFNMRKQQLLDRRWFYLGFAGLAMLLLMVPLLNLLVIPAAVVGHSQYLSLKDG